MANQTNSKAKAFVRLDGRSFPLSSKCGTGHLASMLRIEKLLFLVLLRCSLALLVLVIQIVSGIFLTMNYKPTAS